MGSLLALGLALGVACASGCGSPPSMAPLLRVGERAMREEAQRLRAESVRDAARLEQMRRTLGAAFENDLAQVESPSRGWVLDAAEVYAAAREALAEHGAALRQERERRADNLLAGAEAQRRAIELLEQQDRLIVQTIGVDVWRLLEQNTSRTEGDGR